jgi:hypothetical protein
MADPIDRPAPTDPHLTPRAQAGKAARQARLAAEMRDNLVKRKRQQRARDARAPVDDEPGHA